LVARRFFEENPQFWRKITGTKLPESAACQAKAGSAAASRQKLKTPGQIF
jgi:hypothetical protein